MNRTKTRATLLDAQATTGTGKSILVSDFKNLILEISTASSANLTVKIQGSIADTAPTFSSAASVTNPWTYIASYDLENPGSIIPGSTGIIFTGTDAVYNIMPNIDGLNYICVTVTARSAGSVTVKLLGFDNL